MMEGGRDEDRARPHSQTSQLSDDGHLSEQPRPVLARKNKHTSDTQVRFKAATVR